MLPFVKKTFHNKILGIDFYFQRIQKQFNLSIQYLNIKLVDEIILDYAVLLFNECAIAYCASLRDKMTNICLSLTGPILKRNNV